MPFLMTQIVEENLARFAGGTHSIGGHRHSVFYLLGMFVLSFLPWSLFLPAAVTRIARLPAGPARDLDVRALTWTVTIVVFYSLSESKRSVYLLPVFPAAALLVGGWLAAFVRGEVPGRWVTPLIRAAAWIVAIVVGALLVAFATQLLGMPIIGAAMHFAGSGAADELAMVSRSLAEHAASIALWLTASFAAACATAAACKWQRRGLALVGFLAVLAGLFGVTQQHVMPAVAQANTRRDFAEALRRTASGDLQTRPNFDYATVFYYGASIPLLDASAHGAGAPFLLMRRSQWQALDWRERSAFQPVPRVDVPKQGNQEAYLLARRIEAAGIESSSRP
jgi:4-amino-4-deoxy-L-arabinose transferase-like glycosyltransferase